MKRVLRGTYSPPPDKSITHRALFFSALAHGLSVIKNPLATGDCLSTLSAFKKLGIQVSVQKKIWKVRGGLLKRPGTAINCQNSGTSMRLLAGLLSSQNFDSTLTGDASLSKRPMKRVMVPLKQMGAVIHAKDGNFAPLKIQGNPNLRAINYQLPVASAQVKSSILLAGLSADGTTTVTEPTKSRDHTERMLKQLGAKIQFNPNSPLSSPNKVSIKKGGRLKSFSMTVPGDFSSAAFFIAAALIVPGSDIVIKNVNLNPTRTGLFPILKRMGADIKIIKKSLSGFEPVGDIRVKYSTLKGTDIRKDEIPLMIDEVPILAVLATQARGKTEVSGAEELRVKESDRLKALAVELGKLGADIKEKPDGLVIQGPTALCGAVCESYHDHRIAMSLAVANLISQGKITIKNFSCTKVSYPNFLGDLKKLVKNS